MLRAPNAFRNDFVKWEACTHSCLICFMFHIFWCVIFGLESLYFLGGRLEEKKIGYWCVFQHTFLLNLALSLRLTSGVEHDKEDLSWVGDLPIFVGRFRMQWL